MDRGNNREYWTYFLALMVGLLGMALYLGCYHLYLDHKFVDDIRNQLIQQQQQQRK